MAFDINIWAVVAGGISAVVVGFVWYAPPLWRNVWAREAGIDPAAADVTKIHMAQRAFIAFVLAFVLSWVMAHFSVIWGVLTLGSALELGFWIWLGFMVPLLAGPALWERRSMTYVAIHAGYWLITTVAIAAIVSLWS